MSQTAATTTATTTTQPAVAAPTTPPAERPKVLTVDVIPRNGHGYFAARLLRAMHKHTNGGAMHLTEVSTLVNQKLSYQDIARLDHVGLLTINAEDTDTLIGITPFGREVAQQEPTRIVITADNSVITLFRDDREDPYSPRFIGTNITARYIVLTALQVVTSEGIYVSEDGLYDLIDKRDQLLVRRYTFYQCLRGLVQDGTIEDRRVFLGGNRSELQYRVKPSAPTQPPPITKADVEASETIEKKQENTSMTDPAKPHHTLEAATQQSLLAALLQTAEDFCEALGQSIRALPRENRTAALELLETVEDFVERARSNG